MMNSKYHIVIFLFSLSSPHSWATSGLVEENEEMTEVRTTVQIIHHLSSEDGQSNLSRQTELDTLPEPDFGEEADIADPREEK